MTETSTNSTAITPERLREFTSILQRYKTGKASLERRVVAAENWWKLRNRFEERKSGFSGGEGFHSESGWLHNVIVSKHADAMEAYPEPVILPREPGDRELAQLLSAVLPCVLEQNRFEKTYDACMWQKLKTGTAAYRVVWDGELCGGLGDIRIERVDLLNLFWEPGISDIQDSPYLFCTHLENEESICEQFPRLRGRLRTSPFMATRFVYDDAVSTEGKVTVIEVYYKKQGLLHYCKYVGDTVLCATEEAGENEFRPAARELPDGVHCPEGHEGAIQSTERGEESWRRQIMTAEPSNHHVEAPSATALALDRAAAAPPRGEAMRGLYDHGRYPFVLDPLFPVEGSPCGYGFVDLCANAQTAIDLMRTAFIKNTLVGATPRYFQRIDGSVNEEEFTDLSRPLVHVSGNLGEDSLRQIGFAGLPGVYVSVLESSIRELRETTGNTETATGTVNSGVTAASAIAALQEASGKGSRDATRASYEAFREIVELCIELIRQFYSLPRQFRITGSHGIDFVTLDNRALRARVQRLGPLEFGLREPSFDVRVSAQKRNAYSRLSQNELAMELYRMGLFEPGKERQALALLELMEFDGREELRERFAASLRLGEQIEELRRYRELAIALTARYRPERLRDLGGEEAQPPAPSGAEEQSVGDPLLPARARSALAPLPEGDGV